jgi:hypothetical protein
MNGVIPPNTVVKLKKLEPDWEPGLKLGDTFRIGYYSKHDGTDCVWLVNAAGAYEQTWDQTSLEDYFDIVNISYETDIYGENRPKLEPIA